MNYEYVIFEELLDANDFILEQLKDILTAKVFRNGTQIFPIKTKFIICCTNKDRVDFAKNDSLKALMERFPLEYKVVWNAYTRDTYKKLFLTMLGQEFPTLEYVLEKLHLAQSTVSPRTAMKAARVLMLNNNDYSLLDYFADFSGKNKQMVQGEISKYKSVAVIEDLMAKTTAIMKKVADIELNNLENIREVRLHMREVDAATKELQGKRVDDELQKKVNAAVASYEAFIIQKGEEIKNAI